MNEGLDVLVSTCFIGKVFVAVEALASGTARNSSTARSISSEENLPLIVFLLGVTVTLIALDLSLNDHKESWFGKDNVTFCIRVFFKVPGV